MKVLVADDHALMREGIHIVLARLGADIKIVEAANFKEVLQQLKGQDEFDLVLLDLTMPGKKPFTGLKCVIDAAFNTPIVVLSASETPADMHQSIELGAKGFIPKSVSNEVLLAALELVLSGGMYLPTQLFDYAVETGGVASTSPVRSTPITRRQKEVLTLLSLGNTNKEIGRKLGLSEGTVRTHITAIFRTLDVSNRTQAGVRAQELGLFDQDP